MALGQKKKIKIYVRVKKCHFGNFSERAGMAGLVSTGTQKVLIGIEKLFLFWVGMTIYGYYSRQN